MIQVSVINNEFILDGYGVYHRKLITCESNGDTVRIFHDGKKILARPFGIFTNSTSDLNPESAQDVVDFIEDLVKYKTNGHNNEDYEICSIVRSDLRSRELNEIDYTSTIHLTQRLHPEHSFLNNGLLDVSVFYKDYVDENDKGTEVLRVEHSWTLDTSISIPAAQKILSRTKSRKWKLIAGGYGVSVPSSKIYDTTRAQREEGIRRRDTLIVKAQEGSATILIITGQATDASDAEQKLLALFTAHKSAIDVYNEVGLGSVYDDITNDATHSWLDQVIGTTAQAVLGLPTGWDAKEVREYIVEKLKGNV